MKISFIVPTLNELDNIPLVLDLINEAAEASAVTFEIVFVDDKSTDGTVEEIEKHAALSANIKLVHSPKLNGLGSALKLGISSSEGDFILFLDSDVSVRALDLTKLIKAARSNEMVIGSRYIDGGNTIGAPFFKVILSKALNFLISRYLRIPAIDISHSLRVFPSKILAMPLNNSHPAFFWELSMIANCDGLTIREVPVTFRERIHGISKNKTRTMIKSVVKGFKTVLSLKDKR